MSPKEECLDVFYVVNALSMQLISDMGWVPYDLIVQWLPKKDRVLIQASLKDMVSNGVLETRDFRFEEGPVTARWRPVPRFKSPLPWSVPKAKKT